MPLQTDSPITDNSTARIEALEELLSALPGEAMLGSELDGFLAGVLVCPRLLAPSAWLPSIWGTGGPGASAVFENKEQAQSTLALVMAHYNSIAHALLDDRCRYNAIFDVDTRSDDTLWEIWIEGFARAVGLAPASWIGIANADKATRAAFAGMQALVDLANGTSLLPEPDATELTKLAPDLIPGWLEDLYAGRPSARETAPSLTGWQGAKVGRNHPCLCGSGLKHKKCCGRH